MDRNIGICLVMLALVSVGFATDYPITLLSPASGSGSNITNTTFTYEVADTSGTKAFCNLIVDGVPEVYTEGANTGNDTWTLYNSSITNILNTSTNLTDGIHNWSIRCMDETPCDNVSCGIHPIFTSNYNLYYATSSNSFTIDTHAPVCNNSVMAIPSSYFINLTYSPNDFYQINISCSDNTVTSTGITPFFYMCRTTAFGNCSGYDVLYQMTYVSTSGNNYTYTVSIPSVAADELAGYPFIFRFNDTYGNGNMSANTYWFNVSKSVFNLSMTSDDNVSYESSSIITGSSCSVPGGSDLQCSIIIDGTLSNSLPSYTIAAKSLSAGIHTIEYLAGESQNYSIMNLSKNITILKASATATLFLNNESSDVIVSNGTELNLSALMSTTEGTVDLYINGTSVGNNYVTSALAAGLYNVTAVFNATENYTGYAVSKLLQVVEQTTPSENITTVSIPVQMVSEKVISGNTINVTMPAGTNITGTMWNSSISLVPEEVTVSNPSGVVIDSAFEVGAEGVSLNLSNAVRILMSNKGGKHLGFYRNGNFIEVTAVCANDSQAAGDSLGEGQDCKIIVGSDLVMWTKHFTTFATYSLAATAAPSGGSGLSGGSYGGGSTNSYVGVIRSGGEASTEPTEEQTPTTQPSVPKPKKPAIKLDILDYNGVAETQDAKVGDSVILLAKDENGIPVENAIIQISSPSGKQFSIVTDGNGKVDLFIDEAGVYTFYLPQSKTQLGNSLTTSEKAKNTKLSAPITETPVEKPNTIVAEMPTTDNTPLLMAIAAIAIIGITGFVIFSAKSILDSEKKKLDEVVPDAKPEEKVE